MCIYLPEGPPAVKRLMGHAFNWKSVSGKHLRWKKRHTYLCISQLVTTNCSESPWDCSICRSIESLIFCCMLWMCSCRLWQPFLRSIQFSEAWIRNQFTKMLLEHSILSRILFFFCIPLTYFTRNTEFLDGLLLAETFCALPDAVESTRQCPFHPSLWGSCPNLGHGSRNCLIWCFRSKPKLKLQCKEIDRGQQKDKHFSLLTWQAKGESHSCNSS